MKPSSLLVRDRDFYNRVWRIIIPATLQNMISIGINMMDTIMLGQFGEVQISGSSLANQYTQVLHFICMGIAGGGALLTARYWGKKDTDSMKKIITLSLRCCLGITLLFMLAALLFPTQVMRIYTPDMDVIAAGARYFRILAYSFVFEGMVRVLTQILRSFGVSHIQLEASIIGFVLNIFFNWMFIFGKLGAPRMEIAGAAVGTLIAHTVEFLYIGGYFFIRDRKVCYRIRDFFMSCRGQVGIYLRRATPVIGSDLLAGIGDNTLSVMMGHISTEFVAANAITMVLVRLCTAMSNGIYHAASNIIGNTLGEGRTEEAYKQGFTLSLGSFLIGITAGLVIVLIRPLILSLYDINEVTYDTAMQLMLAIAFILGFRTMGNTLTKGVLRGGGDTQYLMVADVISLYVISLPLGYLSAFVWHLAPFWIYVCFRAEFIMKSVICCLRFRSRKWIKKI